MSDPGAVPPPTDEDLPPTDETAPPTEDMAAEPDDAGSNVLFTVTYDKDKGEFTLIEGDEPEPEAAATPEAGAAAAPAGQTFSNKGPLMKAILDIIANAEAGGSEEDQFNEGFEAPQEPTLKAG